MEKKRNIIKLIGVGVFAILIIILVIVIILSIKKKRTQDSPEILDSSNSATTNSDIKRNCETFAILGIDSRTNSFAAGTFSDTVMLVNIDYDTNKVRIASIYRDTEVYSEEYGYIRINNAYYNNGPMETLRCINQTFELNLKNHVTFNFQTMMDIVDKIDGIEVELTQAEVEYFNWDGISTAGTYLLDGEKALAFSRLRKIDTDFRRAERQRIVLFAIFNKLKTFDTDKQASLLEEMMYNVYSNFDSDTLTSKMNLISKCDIEQMSGFPYNFYNGVIDGSWTVVPVTLVDMNKELHSFLYDQEDYNPSEKVLEINEYFKTLASEANVTK